MINSMQMAIIKKDLKTLVLNKRLFPVLLIVPIMFSVVLPSIFILLILLSPETSQDLQQILELIPFTKQNGDVRLQAISLIMNAIVPIFFILIPIMVSSVMAASSFVGEKEKRTLETLLYSPISLKDIFLSKIFAALALSMLISFGSFILMVISTQLETMLIANQNLSLDVLNWIICLFILSPSISLLSITLIVNGSAKAQTVEESQQRAAFLIVPIILLLIGQFTGILLINALLLIILSIIFLLLTFALIKRSKQTFSYEGLLKR